MYEKILKLCRKKRITVYELEKAVGLSPCTIRKWEKNPNPRCQSLYKVARYFRVKMEWLMG